MSMWDCLAVACICTAVTMMTDRICNYLEIRAELKSLAPEAAVKAEEKK